MKYKLSFILDLYDKLQNAKEVRVTAFITIVHMSQMLLPVFPRKTSFSYSNGDSHTFFSFAVKKIVKHLINKNYIIGSQFKSTTHLYRDDNTIGT